MARYGVKAVVSLMIRLGKVNELINIIRDNPEIAKYLTVEMLFTPDMIAIFSEITARHFKDRGDTLEFMQAKWANSERLSERVLSGQFRAEYYKHIKINERGETRDHLHLYSAGATGN